MAESRTKKTLLNAKVNLIFYMLTLTLTFFSRRIFLDYLGAEFLGFTTTLQNLLGFLNLAELGIGTAIAYVLYKPLYDADQVKISEIITVLGYLYRCIGYFIFSAGIILALFLPLIFPHTEFSHLLIYFAFFSYLSSSLIGYFINYRQNLLCADQRNYVVAAYFQSINILKTLIQIGSIYYTYNYYIWIGIEFIFGIIYSFILNWKIKQVYPWLKPNLKQGRHLLKQYPEVTRCAKQVFFHRLGGVALYQTTPLLVYAFTSLSSVALYSNYTIIIGKLGAFYSALMDSTAAGVGNLIAERNTSKILSVFWELISIRYFVGAILTFCIFILIQPFIALWLGKEYILNENILSLICISAFIGYSRGAVEQFLHGFGLYWDIWAPVVELVINIGVACICGYYWGLPGVLMGGVISQLLIIKIWKPWFLFHYGFKKSIWTYVLKMGATYLCIGVPALIVYYFSDKLFHIAPDSSYMSWCIYAATICATYSLITFTVMIFFNPFFRNSIYRLYKSKFAA